MPHLSPMNWILAPALFWILLMSLSSSLWWSQSLSFPETSSSFIPPLASQWQW